MLDLMKRRKVSAESLVREAVGDDWPALIRAQKAIALGRQPEGMEGLEIEASDMTKAFRELADRQFGRPKQAVEHTVLDRAPAKYDDLTDEQLDARIADEERREQEWAARKPN